ncbi:MAG: ATP-binding protein, partial [Candidatus Omnitrophota bacterium]
VVSDEPYSIYKLKAMGVYDYFESIICLHFYPEIKPATDMFLESCHFLNVDPEGNVSIGDSLEKDIRSVESISMRGIHVPTPAYTTEYVEDEIAGIFPRIPREQRNTPEVIPAPLADIRDSSELRESLVELEDSSEVRESLLWLFPIQYPRSASRVYYVEAVDCALWVPRVDKATYEGTTEVILRIAEKDLKGLVPALVSLNNVEYYMMGNVRSFSETAYLQRCVQYELGRRIFQLFKEGRTDEIHRLRETFIELMHEMRRRGVWYIGTNVLEDFRVDEEGNIYLVHLDMDTICYVSDEPSASFLSASFTEENAYDWSEMPQAEEIEAKKAFRMFAEGLTEALCRHPDFGPARDDDLTMKDMPRPIWIKRININELIEEELGNAVRARGGTVERKTLFDRQITWVEVDELLVRRILLDLFTNACEATRDIAVPTVSVSTRTAPDDRLYVEVTASDNGHGMTPRQEWLVIMRELVEQNNGTIKVESRVGEGTTFTVRLPADLQDVRRKKAASAGVGEIGDGPERDTPSPKPQTSTAGGGEQKDVSGVAPDRIAPGKTAGAIEVDQLVDNQLFMLGEEEYRVLKRDFKYVLPGLYLYVRLVQNRVTDEISIIKRMKKNEVDAITLLDHQCHAKIKKGRIYPDEEVFLMPDYGGITLKDYINQSAPIEEDFEAWIKPLISAAILLYEALEEMHKKGISHNDLRQDKPDHILYSDNIPHILDYHFAHVGTGTTGEMRRDARNLVSYIRDVTEVARRHFISRETDIVTLEEIFAGIENDSDMVIDGKPGEGSEYSKRAKSALSEYLTSLEVALSNDANTPTSTASEAIPQPPIKPIIETELGNSKHGDEALGSAV